MTFSSASGQPPRFIRRAIAGFTLVELLAVIAITAVLAALLMPALAKARARANAVICLNNTKQLSLAWLMYADEHEGVLPYNLFLSDTSYRTNLNWADDVMTRDLSSDNTNTATLCNASLAPYISLATTTFRCPADQSMSTTQSAAGWDHRIRSYSMNGMVGDAGNYSSGGVNLDNPDYRQFFKLAQIPHPTDIFVFLDEHPDSISDGNFLNEDATSSNTQVLALADGGAGSQEWLHLPASYHNKNTAFSFADGHAEFHRWVDPETIRPVQPNAAWSPVAVTSDGIDFQWMLSHMSVLLN